MPDERPCRQHNQRIAINADRPRNYAPLLCALGLMMSTPSHADLTSGKQEYHLRAQPFMDALAEWSALSGVEVTWQPDASVERLAPAVDGYLTPEDALAKLLKGRRIKVVVIDEKNVMLRPARTAKGRYRSMFDTRRRDRSGQSVPRAETLTRNAKEPANETVMVTGTHIRGVLPAGSPVIEFDEDKIHSGKYPSLPDLIESLPQNARNCGNGESPDARLSASAGASTNVTFATTASLRCFGSTATLILVNGHRVAPSGQGFLTDLSLIPLAAIKHIEVLTDGASAVYGADAIAGVVNIRLKDTFDGAQTQVRFGFVGRKELSVAQTLGLDWDEGNVMVLGSYEEKARLPVEDRAWTQGVPTPESIFPYDQQSSFHLAGHQNLGERWTAKVDAHIGHTTRLAWGTATPGPGSLLFPIAIDRTDASLGLHYKGTSWELALKGHFSRDDTNFRYFQYPPGASQPDLSRSQSQYLNQHQWITSVAANGPLGRTWAGDIRVALGAEHREEGYSHRLRAPTLGQERTSRTVNSTYVEALVPLIRDDSEIADDSDEQNQKLGGSLLNVSVAARFDDYSDFGDITNPKYGISWMPWSALELRATLSESFRAPSTGAELLTTSGGTNALVSLYSFNTPEGGTRPVAFLTGSREDLEPETAHHWTAGFTFRPTMLEGWAFDLTYYHISYGGRISGPPLDVNTLSNPALQSFLTQYPNASELQAALDHLTGGNLMYVDRTGPDLEGNAFGSAPWDLATTLFDARLDNISKVQTSGWDLGVTYEGELHGGEVGLSLTGNYINEINTTYTPGASVIDTKGTIGSPAGLRLNAEGTYTRGGWHAGLSLNFTRDYRDILTNAHVDSYTTADVLLRYTFGKGQLAMLDDVSVRFAVENVLNTAPPDIIGTRANRGATYDPTNAPPLGRQFRVEIFKLW
jgi:outer membrane receptor protein involved in Fe transport